MVFPEAERVLYGTNLIEEVICQLRFPPILRIDSGGAADFQDAIRADYPLYSEEESIPELPLPAPLAKALNIGQQGASPARKFTSADGQWTIALAQNFVALSTEHYERWEGFHERLRQAVDALEQVYRPAFYTRVGLRYKNVIQRSKLGLGDDPWSALLAPAILSELRSDLAAAVREVNHVAVISLDDVGGTVRIRHGLAREVETGDEVYGIDADFFTDERTERDAINDRLGYFNTQAARFIRWCLTDRLHRAMAPQLIQ